MQKKLAKNRKGTRPPRICVPNKERALFTLENEKFVGVLQRLSLTGGSAILSKGPIPYGALSQMDLNTVFGRVRAQIEFLHRGADGVALAQAFRLVSMDAASERRYTAAAKQMADAGFSDAQDEQKPHSLAFDSLNKIIGSIRRLSAVIAPR
jgi:hypothetical protein